MEVVTPSIGDIITISWKEYKFTYSLVKNNEEIKKSITGTFLGRKSNMPYFKEYTHWVVYPDSGKISYFPIYKIKECTIVSSAHIGILPSF